MLLNKVTNIGIDSYYSIEQWYILCIKSKYIKIVRYKKMTLITHKLKEIHANLWKLYNPLLLLKKIYVGLLFNEFTYKSWILPLWSKDKFFNIFKLWLPCTEACKKKFKYLETNGIGEFISATLIRFYKKKSITIGYVASYMYKKTG